MRAFVVLSFMIARALDASAQVPAVALPRPTGPHAVGAIRYHWVDSLREEFGSSTPRRRGVIARLWYPASHTGGPVEPYLPQIDAYEAAGLIGPRTIQLLRRVTVASISEAPLPPGRQRFPVIVFSPGNGEMEFMYTTLAQELASHGYVFVLLVHPGVSAVVFPDGVVQRRYRRLYDPKPDGWEAALPASLPANLKRAVYDTMYTEAARYLTADVSLAIGQIAELDRSSTGRFTGRLDLDRVATLGHSYGGNVAVEACFRDPRVRACMSLDGGAFGPVRDSGLTNPYMILRPAWDNDGTPRGIAQEQLIGSHRSSAYEVNIAGAQHRSFMDAHFLSAPDEATATSPQRVLEITSAYLRAFLARHLNGQDAPSLLTAGGEHPEVHLRVLRSELGRRP